MVDANVYDQEEIEKRINNALVEFMKLSEQDRTDNNCHWIVFTLDNAEYAINAKYVLRVAGLREIVPYAGAPAYCPGVMWDRNGIIRLLDLRVLLGQGNYLSAIARENKGLPMIIIIEPDGKRRGIIVDKIDIPEDINALAIVDAGCTQSKYIKGSIKYDPQREPALIMNPKSFNDMEYEDQNAKIDWKGRIDIKMIVDNDPILRNFLKDHPEFLSPSGVE